MHVARGYKKNRNINLIQPSSVVHPSKNYIHLVKHYKEHPLWIVIDLQDH